MTKNSSVSDVKALHVLQRAKPVVIKWLCFVRFNKEAYLVKAWR